MNLADLAVGVDFSDGSRAALRRARALAAPRAVVRLVHAIDTAVYFRGPTYGDAAIAESVFRDLIRSAECELDAFAEELRVAGFAVQKIVKVGRPADVLLEAARGADMLLVGTHGRGFLGRALLGSVAEDVARRSVVPVLVVREKIAEQKTERVLIAVDPSGPSRDAIRVGAAIAERLGARLEAIHAAYLPPVLPYAESGALQQVSDVLGRHLEAAPSLIGNMIERTIGQRGVKVHVLSGPPAAEIARFATPRDIVVCGTHGRSALGKLVFGSVAAKILREAPCPVVVVRPADDESVASEMVGAAPIEAAG